MGAFIALQNFYNMPLYERARRLRYHESNIYVLLGDEQGLKLNFPRLYNNLLSCKHNRDSRTAMEYGQDMVASWIFEDDLIRGLQKAGLRIFKAGADKKRLLLPSSRISSGSDTRIFFNGRSRRMEIMCDYKGYWADTGTADLRDNKYDRLKKEKALFLGIDVMNKRYMLIDFSENVTARYIASHKAYGGKPAYSIDLARYKLKAFSCKAAVGDILSEF